MFTTNKAVRVLGFTGVVGALALTQACSPNASEEVNVNVTKPTVSPKCGMIGQEPCTFSKYSTGDGTKGTYPKPPAGYVVKWSRCTNWTDGDGNVRNNSRIVNVAEDGTVPIQRAEPVVGGKDNTRRINLSKLPKGLALGGKGTDRATGKYVQFVKLGQTINVKSADGSVTTWIVSSENLGTPVQMKDGYYAYRDRCFRNPKYVLGRDTAAHIADGTELATTCVVEDVGMEYNALSYYAYTPIINYADTKVASANDPATSPHPDDPYPTYEGFDGIAHVHSGYGAALNDINGTERDSSLVYITNYEYCHMIVTSGYEVPGAKRPATRSFPAPGSVNTSSLIAWRPVNTNLDIANEQVPVVPDPIEPDPEPSMEAVPEDATTPA